MTPTVEWHNLDLMGDGYESLLSRVREVRPDFVMKRSNFKR